MTDPATTPAPFFIVGAPRSGTTLLRNILREHPNLASPEETFFYRWSEPFGTTRYRNFLRNDPVMWRHRELDGCSENAFWSLYDRVASRRELQDAYMEAFLKRHDRSDATWFDKTPQNTYALLLLVSDYPEACVIHVHRNPLNVVSSIRAGRTVGPESLRGAINMWIEAVQAAEAVAQHFPRRVIRVSYEQLTETPGAVVNETLVSLGLPEMEIPPHVPVYPARQRFHEELSAEEIARILSRCEPWLNGLGYAASAADYEAPRREAQTATVRKRIARVRRKVSNGVTELMGPGRGLKSGCSSSADEGILPSTSLYLRDALEDAELGVDWHASRVTANGYIVGKTAVLVRYATEDEWTAIQAWTARRDRRLVYVVDDDLPAILEDNSLPAPYRKRLQPFVDGVYQEIVRAADTVVVSSPSLRESVASRGKHVVMLDPYWRIPSARPTPATEAARAELRLIWPATRSHMRDLAAVWPQVRMFLQRHPHAHLTVFVGKKQPPWLKRAPRVENLPPLAWTNYRSALNARQWDIAICPMRPTAVNRARSFSKFFELACSGGLPVLSQEVPFAGRLAHNENSILVGSEDWCKTLSSLAESPDERERLAAAAHADAVAMAHSARARQVSFWRHALELT